MQISGGESILDSADDTLFHTILVRAVQNAILIELQIQRSRRKSSIVVLPTCSALGVLVRHIAHKRPGRPIISPKPLPNLNTKHRLHLALRKLIPPQRHDILLRDIPRAPILNTVPKG